MADARKRPPYADLDLSEDVVLFDFPRFDRLIATHGVRLLHYKAVRCPIGVKDEYDVHSHAGHDDCSNGLLYRLAGTVTGVIQNNQGLAVFDEAGVMDGSTVQGVLARYYDDSDKEMNIQSYDRIYIADEVVASTIPQLFEHSQTGVDKVQYPVLSVEFMMDSHGREYFQDKDFVIERGLIKWLGQNQPGFDPSINKGDICSVRYSYQAFWYVKNLMHEVRVAKEIDPVTGELIVRRCPQSVMLQREYVFENERNDKDVAKQQPRDVRAPRKAGLGPR